MYVHLHETYGAKCSKVFVFLDYNPLMGSGGGGGYRPSRRNVGGGGGG